MINRTIALDCDGVLLDYSTAYAFLWERAFGKFPKELNPDAYSHFDRWDVKRLEGNDLKTLRAHANHIFWSTMPAIEGAIEACHDLVSMGYELICVTAIDDKHKRARLSNLKDLGFPIDVVYPTGSDFIGPVSPKAEIINKLKPAYFVDDFARYFYGVDSRLNRVLIDRNPIDSPNIGHDDLWDRSFDRLDEFVHWLKIYEGL